MEKLALSFAAVALVSGAAQAATPAYPDNPDVIWKGNFEGGAASLSGNCSYGDNGWCNEQSIRPQQIQVVDDPVFEGHHAVRFEVKYGDAYKTYSDERSSDPPDSFPTHASAFSLSWRSVNTSSAERGSR